MKFDLNQGANEMYVMSNMTCFTIQFDFVFQIFLPLESTNQLNRFKKNESTEFLKTKPYF